MLENRYAWLIQLLETGENITHADAVLQNRQAWFDELIKENALVHSGNVSRILCPQCDEPHDIAINPSTFKGYCVDSGHVSFEPRRIMQYQASPQWMIEATRKSFGITATDKITEISQGTCWKLGSVRLAKKPRPLFFCRNYAEFTQAVDRSIAALADDTGVILLTSPHDNNPERIAGHRTVSISMCLNENGGKNLLSADVLERMWNNQPTKGNQLTHSADYRTVTLNGTTHHFPGDLMRAFVTRLIELHEKGQESARTSEIMTHIGTDHSRRITDLFKGHKTWKQLIDYGQPRGTCRLRMD